MKSNTKSKLTGGTLLIIAFIVLVFSNGRSSKVEKKLDKTYTAVTNIENELRRLRREVKSLRDETIQLKNKLIETSNEKL
jgi:septal ring factor EnvC (AmiA/AmiB activator)